ncbi:MAG: hypothetical protein M9955_15740 [Rhizobiaceae bacterium]|nr:hypothetical protein [Rhizobiaceae bacterium]
MTKKTATVQTPATADPNGPTVAEEIPLPPEHMWAELDNASKRVPAAPQKPTAETPAPDEKNPSREIAQLEFVGRKPIETVPLEYPFLLAGETISEIRVRRLPIGEVGDLIDSLPAGRIDNFEIYAAMTGLPAPVLRGLVDVDGEKVTGVCWDFLPRAFRPAPPPAPASS